MLFRSARLLPFQTSMIGAPAFRRGIYKSIRTNLTLGHKLMSPRLVGNTSLFSSIPPRREVPMSGDRLQSNSTATGASTSNVVQDASAIEKNNDDDTSKSTKKKKISYRDLIKQYGTLAVGFHSVVWTGTLGITWALVYANADAALRIFELVPFLDREMLPDEASEFLIAYTLTSVTGPPRFALDLVAMPWLARRLKASPRFAAWIPGLPTSAIHSAAAAADGIIVDVNKPVSDGIIADVDKPVSSAENTRDTSTKSGESDAEKVDVRR